MRNAGREAARHNSGFMINTQKLCTTLPTGSTFGAWLKKIIVNKCLNHIKKKKIDLTLCETLPPVIYEEDEEVKYETEKIFKSIEMLPDGYRIILTLYLIEGYDHSEISQILGITESTSKSQYSRAKEKLRNILSKN